MPVTIEDIARAAGVGETTVRRALGDKADVSPQTKARIKQIAADMKYRPNRIARFLVTGQSNQIGVVAAPSAFHTALETIEWIERELRDAGYSMVLANSGGHPGGERESLEQLVDDRVAGVIAVPASHGAEPDAYQELLDAGVQLVTVDRRIEGLQVPQTVGDDYKSAKIAAEHLLSLGHQRIAYLAIPQTCYAGRDRMRGYEDALREAGLPIDPSLVIETPFGEDEGMKATRQLLGSSAPPTAIMARHDIVATGAMRAVFAAGLSIPEDISIVGNGGLWFDDILRVPLTTVEHPMQDMARKAVAKLLTMLSGATVPPETEVLDVNLVIRDTTAPPRSR